MGDVDAYNPAVSPANAKEAFKNDISGVVF
jgi:hypothetical protein